MFEAIADYARPFGDKLGLVVEDLKTGEKIQQTPHKAFSSASLIKYPIMWVFFREVAQGRQSLETVHILKNEDKAGSSPFDSSILREFHQGLELTLEDCVKLMMVISDDTATNIIMKRLGIDYINTVLKGELGFTDSSVGRFMMDYEGLEAGRDNFVSAHDINSLSLCICRNKLLPEDCNRQMLEILCNQRHNDTLRRDLPMSLQMGAKGGRIRQYGMQHDCGIMFEAGTPRFLVNVLTQSIENSTDVIAAIGRMVYDCLDTKPE